MALPPLAEISDLAAWLGEEIDDDNQRAEALLAAASRLVRAETRREWRTEDDELDDGDPALTTDALEVAQQVTVSVAARMWANPTGVIHETEGPFSARWSEQVAEGLYLTDTEKAMLARYSTQSTSGLWTLATTRGDTPDVETVAVEYTSGLVPAEPLPWSGPE